MESQRKDHVIIEIDDDLIEIEQMRAKQSFFTKHKDKVIKGFKALFVAVLALTAGFALIYTFDDLKSENTINREMHATPSSLSKSHLSQSMHAPPSRACNTRLSLVARSDTHGYHIGLRYENLAARPNGKWPAMKFTPTGNQAECSENDASSDDVWIQDGHPAYENCASQKEEQFEIARSIDIEYTDSSELLVQGGNGEDAGWNYVVPIGYVNLRSKHFIDIIFEVEERLRLKFIQGGAYKLLSNNCFDFAKAFVHELKEGQYLTKELTDDHLEFHSASKFKKRAHNAAVGGTVIATALHLPCLGIALPVVVAFGLWRYYLSKQDGK